MNKFVILLAIISLALGSPTGKSKHVENTPENLALIDSGDHNENIELLSGQYQGDMVLSEQQKRVLKSLERTGLIDVNMRWPNRVVPYVLSDVFSDEQKSYIEAGLAELSTVSCLTFTPQTDEQNYVRVNGQDGGCWSEVGFLNSGEQEVNLALAEPGVGCFRIGTIIHEFLHTLGFYHMQSATGQDGGCWSEVGFLNSGEQEVNLALAEPGVGCFRIGTIIHEFLHTLGFYHMQSATERDDYVKIAWENILPGLEHNFDVYPADMISNFGVDYDVLSVMHYPAYGFTNNGYATIIPHDITLIKTMGQREGMSDKDISRLNSMYQCNEVEVK